MQGGGDLAALWVGRERDMVTDGLGPLRRVPADAVELRQGRSTDAGDIRVNVRDVHRRGDSRSVSPSCFASSSIEATLLLSED
jgi:hypothetical protein